MNHLKQNLDLVHVKYNTGQWQPLVNAAQKTNQYLVTNGRNDKVTQRERGADIQLKIPITQSRGDSKNSHYKDGSL